MKKLLFVLFTLPLFLYAQTDSIESKLSKYKMLYSDSLINEQEYTKLKEYVLFPQPKRKTDADFKKKFRGQIIAGSILFGGGLGTVIGGAIYKINNLPYVKTDNTGSPIGYSINPNQYKGIYIGMFTIGSVSALAGLVLEIIGIKNAVIYANSDKTASIELSKQNIGLCLTFK